MTTDGQSEEKAQASLDFLLGDEMTERIIKATDRQYMAYAPQVGVDHNGSRLVQLFRIAFEFGYGAPRKFGGYWSRYTQVKPADLNVKSALVLLVLALPRATWGLLYAMWASFVGAVVFRNVQFIPKAEFFAALRGKPTT